MSKSLATITLGRCRASGSLLATTLRGPAAQARLNMIVTGWATPSQVKQIWGALPPRSGSALLLR